MWMVVGLGNPGGKYLMNRHNIGFMALDNFTAGIGNLPSREERKSVTCRFKMEDQEMLLVKPQTFMNKSGEAVHALMDFYKIDLSHLIVVHDEIEIPFGTIKIQKNRGAGGHNGLRSINEVLGTQDYYRIRLGVSRPPNPKMDVAAWVLQNFGPEEHSQLTPFLDAAGDALESLIFDGFEKAATKHNRNVLENEKIG
jgi:PTH1 family peptidyl-tRNA hydrolase